jgi:hypothetical protein
MGRPCFLNNTPHDCPSTRIPSLPMTSLSQARWSDHFACGHQHVCYTRFAMDQDYIRHGKADRHAESTTICYQRTNHHRMYDQNGSNASHMSRRKEDTWTRNASSAIMEACKSYFRGSQLPASNPATQSDVSVLLRGTLTRQTQ